MNEKYHTPAEVAEDLLRDVAFALRMARRISSEIRAEQAEQVQTACMSGRARLTESAVSVTLGA